MISVCMGIYNGEAYIREQLQSILNQTLPPDEVILCDDCSGDTTRSIVSQFIEENGLEGKWWLYCNEQNKGYPDNFYYAMSLCRGEYIFLADQDDIWDNHKLELMTNVMKENKSIRAVCCKFGLIDALGNDIHTLMAPARTMGTGALKNIGITDVFYKCEWPGMVVAYSREWYEDKLSKWRVQFPNALSYPEIPHDFLVCSWAAEEGGFRQIDMELAWHRRHDSNTGKEEHRLSRLIDRERKLKEISEYLHILQQFDSQNVMQTQAGREALEQKKTVMEDRYRALDCGSIRKVLANAWKHRRGTRIATAACDLVIAIRKK